jgi:iron(III) transport system permease protein
MPGIMLSALLVFLLTIGELSVPLFLRYQVFPAESFIQFSAFYNFNAATATALPLAGIAIVALALEERFLHNKTCLPRIHARNCRSSMQLGRWHIPVFAIISSCAIIFIMTPVATLLVQAGSTYPAALRKAGSSLSRGISYAFIGASIITFLGFFSGYIIQKKQPPFWHALDSLMLFLFVLPGSVIGIGLISLWNHSYTNFVYTTPLIIILGYIAKYTAISSRVCAATLTQIPPSMEDAAQVSGAGWFSSITTISIPMARHGLLAAWLATYTFLLRDTDVTMLVYPAGHETLAVRIFTMMANGNPNLIAALCIIMMTAALLPAALFFMTFKKYITRMI